MTQIANLPALTTITNSLIFPAADTSDNNRTKKVTLAQLVALSAGPRGPIGIAGAPGPSGPSGPSGPNANQLVNTSSFVSFQGLTITNISSGITFGDNTVQKTAYKKSARDLVELSSGNISFTVSDIKSISTMLTGSPSTSGRSIYLPIAHEDIAGTVLIFKNRSNLYSFEVWGGIINLGSVSPNNAIQVACDGFSWFLI